MARLVDSGPCGTWIARDLLPRIFDAFVQGSRGVDRADGGLGLGLAIVKSLVTLHKGTIDVASDETGSTFTIRLPRTTTRASTVSPASAQSRPTAPQRVLVVDDNEDAGVLLGELVRTCGHDVTVVHTPAAALEMLEALKPEIAILDIGLPGMDGYQLAAHIRRRGLECRLVALTGYGTDDDRERSRTAGFDLHLVKPVQLDQLLAAFDRWSPHRAARGSAHGGR